MKVWSRPCHFADKNYQHHAEKRVTNPVNNDLLSGQGEGERERENDVMIPEMA